MKLCLTGATGFVGQALVQDLLAKEHAVLLWVRSEPKARALWGDRIELLTVSSSLEAKAASLRDVDGIINLAGENLFQGRWTAERKERLVQSRVESTQQIVRAMELAGRTPRVFVSASAIGYYGSQGDATLDEDCQPGSGFLAELTQQWEQAAQQAAKLGVRTVVLRLGIVLAASGGVLARLAPLFRRGLGAKLGTGRQYLSWVELADLLVIIERALLDERIRGAINVTSPEPVTNADFTRALARVLRRPALMRVPEFVLKAALGEAAAVLLGSQRVIPKRLIESGYTFQFPRIEDALAHALQ